MTVEAYAKPLLAFRLRTQRVGGEDSLPEKMV